MHCEMSQCCQLATVHAACIPQRPLCLCCSTGLQPSAQPSQLAVLCLQDVRTSELELQDNDGGQDVSFTDGEPWTPRADADAGAEPPLGLESVRAWVSARFQHSRLLFCVRASACHGNM